MISTVPTSSTFSIDWRGRKSLFISKVKVGGGLVVRAHKLGCKRVVQHYKSYCTTVSHRGCKYNIFDCIAMRYIHIITTGGKQLLIWSDCPEHEYIKFGDRIFAKLLKLNNFAKVSLLYIIMAVELTCTCSFVNLLWSLHSVSCYIFMEKILVIMHNRSNKKKEQILSFERDLSVMHSVIYM
jgi:hypothetical protein